MRNGFSFSPAFAAKIGSILVHVEEGLGTDGHAFDWEAAKVLLADEDVQGWLDHLRKLALLPVKRKP